MIIYLLLVFTNEKRAQIYSYPNIENKQIKLLTEFTYQKLYKLHNYKFNKPNMIPQRDRFLFRISDKTYTPIENYKKSIQKNEYDYFYNSKRMPGKKLLNLKFLDK